MKFEVKLSNRHIHLTREACNKLFGEGYEFTALKPGVTESEYAAAETLTVVGPKGQIPNVRILAPCRRFTQVELLRGDCIKLGISAPVVESGNLENAGPCRLIGPAGELDLEHAVIIASRHVHVTTDVAEKYGLKDHQIVSIRVPGDRAIVFENIMVHVYVGTVNVIHFDLDEGNAACITNGDQLELIV